MNELAIEQAKAPFISCGDFYQGTATSVDLDDEVQRIFFDELSGKLFCSTMAKVLEAEYHVNRKMTSGLFVSTHDWYDLLGIEDPNDLPWPNDQIEVGWEVNDSFQWLDFDHEKHVMDIPMEDGLSRLEAIIIKIPYPPEPEDYYNY